MSEIKVGTKVYANSEVLGIMYNTEGFVKAVEYSGAEFPLYTVVFCGQERYLYEYEFFVIED